MCSDHAFIARVTDGMAWEATHPLHVLPMLECPLLGHTYGDYCLEGRGLSLSLLPPPQITCGSPKYVDTMLTEDIGHAPSCACACAFLTPPPCPTILYRYSTLHGALYIWIITRQAYRAFLTHMCDGTHQLDRISSHNYDLD